MRPLNLNTAIKHFYCTICTLVYNDLPSNLVWLQRIRRYSKNNSFFDYISPHCDLDPEDNNPFPRPTPAHDDAVPLQVWLNRMSSSDDIFKTKPAHMDTVIPKYPTKLGVVVGEGGWVE